ncbi:MAG: hypothetical protein JOY69_05645 [Candidatus Eremiobacteraeota bacterium]|nr:hypothetical protein [Candidatus Eremiobacteraeota bacterium]
MASSNGQTPSGPLEVGEVLQLQMEDGSTLEFEVRAILEDSENQASYAILERDVESADEGEVIVTDLHGNLVEDEDLAQEVLDNYLIFAEEAGDEGSAKT